MTKIYLLNMVIIFENVLLYENWKIIKYKRKDNIYEKKFI